MTREENACEAARLRHEEGLCVREIAERMGVAKSTASTWLCDPDGSKLRARKDTYRGTCIDCGGQTDGSNGPGKAPERCLSCRAAHEAEITKTEILDAIRRWDNLHGEPPRVWDWSTAHARIAGKPYRGEGWPSLSMCDNHFGNLHAAIRAAGLEPAPYRQMRKGLDSAEVARLYADPTATVASVAKALGVRPRTVTWHLERQGVRVRVVNPPRVDDATHREIARAYLDEVVSLQEIADRYGIASMTVRRCLHRQGIACRPRGTRYHREAVAA